MDSAIENPYDALPYENLAHASTRPAHMHAIGTLFGLTPPEVRTARVLELGCAGGGNLIPLAYYYPDGQFVGIDYAQRQIDEATKIVSDLELDNITFHARPFDDLPALGRFDYIICHGVYSWVDDPTREHLLDICRTHLVNNGLAIISYNTLPGWNMVRSLREMMLYHTQNFSDPAEKVNQALQLLRFIRDNKPKDSLHRNALDQEINRLEKKSLSYVMHEYLEAENTQFYFHQFVDALQRHELTYVADSKLRRMYAGNLPPEAAEKLGQIPDAIRQEQYIDFIKDQRFRSSIICPVENAVKRDLKGSAIHKFYLKLQLTPNEEDLARDDGTVRFMTENGETVFTSYNMASSTLFTELSKAIQPITSTTLIRTVLNKLPSANEQALTATLEKFALPLALTSHLILATEPGSYVTTLSNRPLAAKLARYQAQSGMSVTNAQHGRINPDDFIRRLLPAIDGSRDIDSLTQHMLKLAEQGAMKIGFSDGAPVTADQRHVLVRQLTENALTILARQALLVA